MVKEKGLSVVISVIVGYLGETIRLKPLYVANKINANI